MSGLVGHRGLLLGATVAPVVPSTWDPAKKAANIALTGGNLTATKSAAAALNTVLSTLGKSSGKWYFEVLYNAGNGSAIFPLIGVGPSTANLSTFVGNEAGSYGYYSATGEKVNNGVQTAYGSAWSVGRVIGVAIDMSAGRIWFSRDNVWQASGNPAAGTNQAFSGLTGTLYAGASIYNGTVAANDQVIARFASGSQTYAPPSGFTAWG